MTNVITTNEDVLSINPKWGRMRATNLAREESVKPILTSVAEVGSERRGALQAAHLQSQQPVLFDELGHVVEAVGGSLFYDRLANFLTRMLGCERYLVMRYAQYARPKFLVNKSLPERGVRLYLNGIYRIDPLLRMARTHVPTRVMTFDRLKQSDTDTVFYEENFEFGEIFDELVAMFPAVGGVWVAVCVDHPSRNFSDEDVKLVETVYPTLARLHDLHIEKCVYGWQGGYLNDSRIALMICDHKDRVVFRNANWTNDITDDEQQAILAGAATTLADSYPISNNRMVHWEPLDASNSVAPDGRAFVIEQNEPGYVDLMGPEPMQRFADHFELTPREKEIVDFILKGHPPALIADKLGVSVGTIRNHKHRLYFKLDITTERELFCMFMDMFLSRGWR